MDKFIKELKDNYNKISDKIKTINIEKIMLFYKQFNNYQLIKSLDGHNILVGCFFMFALLLNLFHIEQGFATILISIIVIIRLINIHIHNINVAFFDKIIIEDNKYKIIENISSYKRMFILNCLVFCEIILLVNKFHFTLILGVIAILPTVYLIGHCINHYITKIIIKE